MRMRIMKMRLPRSVRRPIYVKLKHPAYQPKPQSTLTEKIMVMQTILTASILTTNVVEHAHMVASAKREKAQEKACEDFQERYGSL